MATKIKGTGTILARESATPGTYTTIAQRVSLEGPEPVMDKTDTTHLDSACKQMLPTIVDPKEISGKLWYDPNETTHLTFVSDLLAGTIKNWKMVFPDGMTTPAHWIFPGFVTDFKPTGMESTKYLEAAFKICLTGLPVFTAGA